MHKKDFYKQIASQHELSEGDVTKVMDSALSTLVETLKSGEKVVLTGFGSFEKKKSASREGRNPSTGAKIQIPARHRVTFTAGKTLKETLNNK